jgi:hypothetical protein
MFLSRLTGGACADAPAPPSTQPPALYPAAQPVLGPRAQLISQLADMGYATVDVNRAIDATGSTDPAVAIDWMSSHPPSPPRVSSSPDERYPAIGYTSSALPSHPVSLDASPSQPSYPPFDNDAAYNPLHHSATGRQAQQRPGAQPGEPVPQASSRVGIEALVAKRQQRMQQIGTDMRAGFRDLEVCSSARPIFSLHTRRQTGHSQSSRPALWIRPSPNVVHCVPCGSKQGHGHRLAESRAIEPDLAYI